MNRNSKHIPIMVTEVLEALQANAGGTYLDCTLGGGGHTRAILCAHGENRVVAIDRDPHAVARASGALQEFSSRISILHTSFASLPTVGERHSFDGVLADLGLSTDQLTEGRGFSFADDEAFDMRMNPEEGISAAELVNTADERELVTIFFDGGVGSEARSMARAIVTARPFLSAKALADRIAALPSRKRGVHPATVVFQALRMAVNKELSQIEALMEHVPTLVKSGGRLAVITFHSLEDRAVTGAMRAWEGGEFSALWPGAVRPTGRGRVITRKAITPSDEEVAQNPSSRSARLRVFEFN